MARPKYNKKNYNNWGCNIPCDVEEDECPNNCDLYLLRDAAADERGAIADYLECGILTCQQEIFFDVVEDEMQHFIKTMQLITLFDPVQADALEEAGLDDLVMRRPSRRPKWQANVTDECDDDDDGNVEPPCKEDLPAIRCLTKAIQGELQAINKYQRYMNMAQDERVKEHFCELMNEEKEHVAEFTAALFEFTHEPLEEEAD